MDRQRIAELYAQAELPEAAVSEVLGLLTQYEIGELAQAEVERWHDRAEMLLADAAPDGPAREPLAALVSQLARRPG